MNLIGFVVALIVLGGIVIGAGYGAFVGYEFLSVQWGSLSNDWKAILIVVAALLAACTLFLSASVQSSVRKYGLKGTGKVMAYNDFIHWYSAMKGDAAEAMTIEAVKPLVNQMLLWGGHQVGSQARHLYALFQEAEVDRSRVLDKAGDVYLEIRRDLGLRGTSEDNAIV
ncbi:MAG TPA: hypothetical protein VNI58_04040 [Mariprofundaceae bacterium]|nr:hypothetical protein [Mariprofundaceae bacterium]